MQNNQLSAKRHLEFEDNSNGVGILAINRHSFEVVFFLGIVEYIGLLLL